MVQRRPLIYLPSEAPAGSNNISIKVTGSSSTYMSSTGVVFDAIPMFIEDEWTISFWAKAPAVIDGTPETHRALFMFTPIGSGSQNRIEVSLLRANAGEDDHTGRLQVLVYNPAGTLIQDAEFWANANPIGFFRENTWVHGAITWNGTTINAYWNGQPATLRNRLRNDPGPMSDTVRRVWYGIRGGFPERPWDGRLGHMALWSIVLPSSEIASIKSGLFDIDLTVNQEGYLSRNYLSHYWRPGAEVSPDLGKDYAVGGFETTPPFAYGVPIYGVETYGIGAELGIDIEEGAVGAVTDSDRISDSPT